MDVVSALRSFVRVTEAGSFSAAALDLGLSQPAVSRQISALEDHYGVRLFHRSTSALALAIEGEKMIPMAKRVIEAMDALGESATSEGKAVVGKVRLSLPFPLGLYVSARLPLLLKAHPGLSIELLTRDEPSVLVGEGIDLEIRIGEIPDGALISRRIGWTTAYLVASPDYLQGRVMPTHPADIALHECIYYRRGAGQRAWRFQDGAKEVSVSLAPRLICSNAATAHRAALCGGGLAILSHILIQQDLADGQLINLMPEFPPVRLPINIVYASRRHISLRVQTVLEFIISIVRADQQMWTAQRV